MPPSKAALAIDVPPAPPAQARADDPSGGGGGVVVDLRSAPVPARTLAAAPAPTATGGEPGTGLMRPARIALCTPSIGHGGAERVIAWLADALASRGHDVVFVTAASRDTDFYASPANARRVSLADDAGARGGPGAIAALVRTLRAARPDLVVSFLPRTNVAAVIAGRLAGAKVVVCERTDPRREPLPAATRLGRGLLYPLAHGLVLQASPPLDWGRRRVPFGRVGIIPNPVRMLTRPAGVEREPIVLGMGRLVPAKRFDRLIDVFCRIADEFPALRLRIVGEGPLRAELEDHARRSGHGDRIDVCGPVRDVEAEFARASAYVLTSDFEGFPNVLAEAMSLGVPVVSVDCLMGPSEMIDHGRNGLLVPPGDDAALADAMRAVLGRPELAERLGREATRIGERFAPDAVLDQWERYLDAVVGLRRRHIR